MSYSINDFLKEIENAYVGAAINDPTIREIEYYANRLAETRFGNYSGIDKIKVLGVAETGVLNISVDFIDGEKATAFHLKYL